MWSCICIGYIQQRTRMHAAAGRQEVNDLGLPSLSLSLSSQQHCLRPPSHIDVSRQLAAAIHHDRLYTYRRAQPYQSLMYNSMANIDQTFATCAFIIRCPRVKHILPCHCMSSGPWLRLLTINSVVYSGIVDIRGSA